MQHTVASDAIAVVVNPENPVRSLTLQQLSDIYTGKITNWQQVGGEDRPIVLLSRESNSGTYSISWRTSSAWARRATCCSRPTRC